MDNRNSVHRASTLAGAPSTRRSVSGFRQAGAAALFGVGLSAVFLAMGGWLVYDEHNEREASRRAFEARLEAHDRLLAASPHAVVPVDLALQGRTLFTTACSACHKADGTGVSGLGKDLTRSWFVASLGDADLRAFVAKGRTVEDPFNTTQVPMPAKGGHAELTDSDLSTIVAYVRGLQDPRRMPPLPAPVVVTAAPTEADKAWALAAAGGDAEAAEYIAHGAKVFLASCVACHGTDARGLKGLGKDLVAGDFCPTATDDEVLAVVTKGRSTSDPRNTTRVDMPPKGGNPALSEDDLLDILDYLRALQKQHATTKVSTLN